MTKIAWSLGVAGAVLLHVLVLLFGGWPFLGDDEDPGTLREVELVSEVDSAASEKKKDEPRDLLEAKEEMEAEAEAPPDAAEIVRNLELSAAAAAPALEAASLGAIEQALGGGPVGGEFADALDFSSGGRIGGKAKAGALDEKFESAFGLAEIDQKPRVVFQAAPLYPMELRGKKVEGTVTVIFVVDAAGKVETPRVEKSTHPAFEKPAVASVQQWKFEPGVKAGQRVRCRMRVPIRFQPS